MLLEARQFDSCIVYIQIVYTSQEIAIVNGGRKPNEIPANPIPVDDFFRLSPPILHEIFTFFSNFLKLLFRVPLNHRSSSINPLETRCLLNVFTFFFSARECRAGSKAKVCSPFKTAAKILLLSPVIFLCAA